MTSKSPDLKSILKCSVGLFTLGCLVIIGLTACGTDAKRTTPQHVDLPGIPDSIYVKAVDFLDDSGYSIEVHFETCCTDRILCKGPAGKLFDKNEYMIKRTSSGIWIPLHFRGNSTCPWSFSHLEIRKAGNHMTANTHRFAYGIFDDSSSNEKAKLDPECLKYLDSRYVGEEGGGLLSPESCNTNSSLHLALHDLDSLLIGRGVE